jgi:hypothetical protein
MTSYSPPIRRFSRPSGEIEARHARERPLVVAGQADTGRTAKQPCQQSGFRPADTPGCAPAVYPELPLCVGRLKPRGQRYGGLAVQGPDHRVKHLADESGRPGGRLEPDTKVHVVDQNLRQPGLHNPPRWGLLPGRPCHWGLPGTRRHLRG